MKTGFMGLVDDPEFKPEPLDVELGVGPVGGGSLGKIVMAEGVAYEEGEKTDFYLVVEIVRSRR